MAESINFINRHNVPLPTENSVIRIVTTADEKSILLCNWVPFKKENYNNDKMPSNGFLGTATTLNEKINIGFNAWKDNDDEFYLYQVVDSSEE